MTSYFAITHRPCGCTLAPDCSPPMGALLVGTADEAGFTWAGHEAPAVEGLGLGHAPIATLPRWQGILQLPHVRIEDEHGQRIPKHAFWAVVRDRQAKANPRPDAFTLAEFIFQAGW